MSEPAAKRGAGVLTSTPAMGRPVLSLVLPIYNEEETIPELHSQLQQFLAKLGLDTEVVFVNDGSKDLSLQLLRGIANAEPRYRVLSFARNFGHQTAITAGIDYARGQAVVVMDADLQDPPEVVLEMVDKWRQGYDVVYAKRRRREGETPFKLLTAKIFYRLFAKMIPIEVPLDTGDFRLMSRRVVVALRALRETHRFVRGMVAWIGFDQTAVEYDRPARFAGETKYPLAKMLRFAIDGITSFSVLPLRMATYLGLVVSVFSVGIAIWAMVVHFILHDTVPGWTAQIVAVSLFSSVQLVMIGVLGEYVGRIYEQVKQRPLYVVGDRINLGDRDDDVLEEQALPARLSGPPTMSPPAMPQMTVAIPVNVPAAGAGQLKTVPLSALQPPNVPDAPHIDAPPVGTVPTVPRLASARDVSDDAPTVQKSYPMTLGTKGSGSQPDSESKPLSPVASPSKPPPLPKKKDD